MKKVHVTTEKGWICRSLAEGLANLDGFRVRVTTDAPRDADLTYFVTYLFREFYRPVGRCAALFTHWLPGKHKARYDKIAQQVDHCVVLSKQHEDYLSDLVGPLKVTRVHLPVMQTEAVPKLRVGWFHRSPPGYDDRKRVDLLEQLEKIEWVQVIRSDGGMSTEQLHAAMQTVDVFLTTSDYEAGPMAHLEALSLGKPSVIAAGVGLADEYAGVPGVHLFRRGDFGSMLEELAKVYEPLRLRYEAVRQNTMAKWREDHAAIFRKVIR